jgi:hypothetical protein
MSAMLIYGGGGSFKRSKHMLTKQHYIKDLLNHGIADYFYLESAIMLSDPLTKPVSAHQLEYMNKNLNIIKLNSKSNN